MCGFSVDNATLLSYLDVIGGFTSNVESVEITDSTTICASDRTVATTIHFKQAAGNVAPIEITGLRVQGANVSIITKYVSLTHHPA